MLIRPLLLILLTSFIMSCAKTPPSLPPAVNKSQQVRPVSAFNQVMVGGQLNVNLRTGYSKSQVILHGDPRDLAQITTLVKNNVLQVTPQQGFPQFGKVSAEIRTHFLNSFIYNGAGNITGKNITSGLLDLNLTNRGRTELGGSINLHRLEVHGPGYTELTGIKSQNLQLVMTGKARVQLSGVVTMSNLNLNSDGWLGLHWIKSDLLTIRARGNTFIQLGGVANKLDVELWGKAHFNGRYLRSKVTFVKTHDRSVAEITTLDRQHTFSTDASDIYFYKIPELKADFMAYNGATLDMRDWNNPLMNEYDRYNK